MELSRAPWTSAQVLNLILRQMQAGLHPYTCGTNSRHPELVPTEKGWVCLSCDYKQDWAHQVDVDGKFPSFFENS